MSRFESINFCQNRPKISFFFWKNNKIFDRLVAPPPDPPKQPFHCRLLTTHLCRNNALCCAINFAVVHKCDNNYTGLFSYPLQFWVSVSEDLFNFYGSVDIKRLGTTDLMNS